MSVLEQVRAYLAQYPGLEELRADCLPPQAGGFSLNAVPSEPVLRTYLDGTQLRQEKFTLWGRLGYGADTAAQQENLSWFSDFSRWLEGQNRRGCLPALDSGQTAQSLLPQDTAAPETIGENGLGCYQITLQIVYLQQAE